MAPLAAWIDRSVRDRMGFALRRASQTDSRRMRVTTALIVACQSPPLAAHTVECDGRRGLELARCERHQKMAERCGPIKGEAHYACDREFLLASPLDCSALQGDDARACAAERSAFQACEFRQGMAFMRCVRDATKASPMGAGS